MRGGIPRDEQETTITYDSGEKLVRIYSARPLDIGKMRRAGIKPVSGGKNEGFRYQVPLTKFAWRIKGVGKARVGNIHATFGRKTGTKVHIPGGSEVGC